MNFRTLLYAILFCTVSGAAQAGVIWQSDSEAAYHPIEYSQEQGPMQVEQGHPSETVGLTSSSPVAQNVFVTEHFRFYLMPLVVGYVRLSDHLLPPSPIPDGPLEPS